MPNLTIELTDQEQARLKALAEARGVDLPECARALLVGLLSDSDLPPAQEAVEPLETPSAAPDRKPLWKRAVEAGMAIPVEEAARLPRDGSLNVDHYVYELPKER